MPTIRGKIKGRKERPFPSAKQKPVAGADRAYFAKVNNT
jgi:hypothetical protein